MTEGYLVPAEIAIAVQTRRPEMITPLEARLKKGETLPTDQVTNLIALVKQNIIEADRDEKRIRLLEGMVEDLMAALVNHADTVLKSAHAMKQVERAVKNLLKSKAEDN